MTTYSQELAERLGDRKVLEVLHLLDYRLSTLSCNYWKFNHRRDGMINGFRNWAILYELEEPMWDEWRPDETFSEYERRDKKYYDLTMELIQDAIKVFHVCV